MIIIDVYNNYLIVKDKETFVFSDFEKVKTLLEQPYNYIFTNNSNLLKSYINVIDLKILSWLADNRRVNNFFYLYFKDAYNEIEVIKNFITLNKKYIQLALKYTQYNIACNNIFKMSFNKEKVYKLKERNKDKSEWVDFLINNNIKYNFYNVSGEIKGFKEDVPIEYIKEEGFDYYIVQIENSMNWILYIYTNNEKYLDMKIDMYKFKNYLYGSLDVYEFEDIEKIRDLFVGNGGILNYFGRRIVCVQESKLYNLFYSTYNDIIKMILQKLYESKHELLFYKDYKFYLKVKNGFNVENIIKDMSINNYIFKVEQI